MRDQFQGELDEIAAAGLGKRERVIASAQGAHVTLADGRELLNLCANNYLGLASHPAVIAAARDALDERGYGMASVRFICGTQDIHNELEERISAFLGTEDTILYGSCFDANGGLFETLLGEDDAIISDALNHASIIDGVRLCKARRLRYANADMDELEQRLSEAGGARRRLIATDGVFSMDGYVAPLPRICELAERYGAMVMVDDSHAVGFVGPDGRGTPELHGVAERVDVVTGTLGKALGGASGGYTSGRREAIELLRQRSRPYLFSNSLAPPIVAASLAVLDLLETEGPALRARLFAPHRALPPRARRARARRRARRAPDRAGDVRRRASRERRRRAAARGRRLRGRLLLPRRADGPGAHPHAALGGALRRRRRRPAIAAFARVAAG